MKGWQERSARMLGEENVLNIESKSVAVLGLGGVGGAAFEGLLRAGVGHIIVMDHDSFDETNLNRQMLSCLSNMGGKKVDAAKRRAAQINPLCEVTALPHFFDEETMELLFEEKPDYIIDAIDTMTAKLLVIKEAKKRGLPLISCMGTGNKLDPSKLKTADIYKTSVCPLARVLRRELKALGIKNQKVLYSEEEPVSSEKSRTPGSVSWVPNTAGLMLAGEVLRSFINIKE